MNSLTNFLKPGKTSSTILHDAIFVALSAALLMLIPFFAMKFGNEVNWSIFDFIIAWVLLFGVGFTYKLVAKKIGNLSYKVAVGIAVFTSLFLIWSNLAVGLIGSENNPANWMYADVLAVEVIGAIAARFKPLGMTFAILSTAIAQILTGVIAIIFGLGYPENTLLQTALITGFFAFLWIGSAFMFWNASREGK